MIMAGNLVRCLFRGLVPGLALALSLSASVAQGAESDVEAKVKAAYVFHVLKYVDWPSLPADALHLCIAGSDGITVLLADLAGKQVKERALQVDSPAVPDAGQCQVLYIGRSERRWQEWLARVQGQNLLTISDLDGFARAGGMVGFVPEGGKIRLEVNPDSVRRNNLRVSSKLLELARTVP